MSKKAQGRQLGDSTTDAKGDDNKKVNDSNNLSNNASKSPNRELAANAAEERIKASESRGGSGSMSMKLQQSRRNSKPTIPPISKSEPLVVSMRYFDVYNLILNLSGINYTINQCNSYLPYPLT